MEILILIAAGISVFAFLKPLSRLIDIHIINPIKKFQSTYKAETQLNKDLKILENKLNKVDLRKVNSYLEINKAESQFIESIRGKYLRHMYRDVKQIEEQTLLNGYLNTSDLIKLIRDHVKYERTAKDINTTTSKD